VQTPGNLGGATLKANDSGDGLVNVIPLDSILFSESKSFIKIDVEGMELNVLKVPRKYYDVNALVSL
jgi:FkbM family methyltransferase